MNANGYQRKARENTTSFLKWRPNETKSLTVLSPYAHERRQHWTGSQSVECEGDRCEYCAAGSTYKTRWAVNVKCDGRQLVWEMANATFAALEDVADMKGHLLDLTVQVKRSNGQGRATRYTIIPIDVETGETAALTMPDYVDQIKALCAREGLDPGQELKLLLGDARPDLADAPALAQLEGFLAFITAKTGPVRLTSRETLAAMF